MTTTRPDQWTAAFYGRTARAQSPEQINDHLARQYLTCAHSLPGALVITAVFYDIGPTNWLHPHPPDHITVEGTTLRRDGGLRELLTEAGNPGRSRFDFLITAGLDRLRRNHNDCLHLLTHLCHLGVHTLLAGSVHGEVSLARHHVAPRTQPSETGRQCR